MGASCCRSRNVVASKSSTDAQFSFFDSLPPNVETATINHVYDGDTLTIREHNHSRVRLLGVDAPELKPREAYAEEAADFVKGLCPKGSTVWLQYDTERTDRYDRLLAYVFVRNDKGAGYICVNIAVVEQGLAGFYDPHHAPLSKREILLKASGYARSRKLNIWKKVDLNKEVFCTRNGSAFHLRTCEDLKNTKNPEELTVSAALDRGLNPCRNCHPI